MNKDNALLIVGQDNQSSALVHHRGLYLAQHLAKRFADVDVVSITKMYDGPGTDPVWKKILFGSRDIIFKRVKTIQFGNLVDHVVRFPRLGSVFDYSFRDFWTYVNLRDRLRDHYDMCILAHPRLAFVALRLKQLGRVDTLIYDDWDYFPAHRPGGFFWRHIMHYREIICVRSADGVVSVSRSLQDLRRKQGAKRTAFVPNGVDYDLFKSAQTKLPHPPTLLYVGGFFDAWGADLPLQALPIIKKSIPNIRYMLVGRGSDEVRLRAIVAGLRLEDCVTFCGWQDHERLPSFLAQSDIGVALYRDYDFVRLSRPMKILEYMAGGLPVIGTRVGGEPQRTIEEAAAGETINFSPEAFAKSVLDLLSNRSKYERYSANGVTFAQKHDWVRLLDQELAFAEQLDDLPDLAPEV